MAVRVVGYHLEKRTYKVGGGGDAASTEATRETVVDFDYKIDISAFVFPFGFVRSADPKRFADAGAAASAYQKKKVSAVVLRKEVRGLDFQALRKLVVGYLRAVGWWRGLAVSFPCCNAEVRCGGPPSAPAGGGKKGCAAALLRCCRRETCAELVSTFRVEGYSPLQVFEMVKPMLWTTGMELERKQAAQNLSQIRW